MLSVREIQLPDIASITQYWLSATPAFLRGMGVDLTKLPHREAWIALLSEQLTQPYPEKKSYCLIWELDGRAVGHSNVNKIVFGREAYMHLHLWEAGLRQRGIGADLVKMGLPYFFEHLQLQTIYCEPYALNPAPNKTLEKVGFRWVDTYTTTPGWINFEQMVNLWVLTRAEFEKSSSPLIGPFVY